MLFVDSAPIQGSLGLAAAVANEEYEFPTIPRQLPLQHPEPYSRAVPVLYLHPTWLGGISFTK